MLFALMNILCHFDLYPAPILLVENSRIKQNGEKGCLKGLVVAIVIPVYIIQIGKCTGLVRILNLKVAGIHQR